MVTEFKDGIPSADECTFVEHSRGAKAKRVVEVAPRFAAHATAPRTADPVQGALTAASVSLDMQPNTSYRLIATSAFHFRMSNGASAAATTDIYQPAKTPTIVRSEDKWTKLSAIKATGEADGIIQITPLD